MKLTLKRIKNLIKEELSKLNEGEVPKEVKEKIFAQMKKDEAVPEKYSGKSIEEIEAEHEEPMFWEVDKDHRGAVKHGEKYYYGEI
jgi:ketol-acid reductoisomerase